MKNTHLDYLQTEICNLDKLTEILFARYDKTIENKDLKEISFIFDEIFLKMENINKIFNEIYPKLVKNIACREIKKYIILLNQNLNMEKSDLSYQIYYNSGILVYCNFHLLYFSNFLKYKK